VIQESRKNVNEFVIKYEEILDQLLYQIKDSNEHIITLSSQTYESIIRDSKNIHEQIFQDFNRSKAASIELIDKTNMLVSKIDQTDFPSRFDSTDSVISDLKNGIEKLFERLDLEEKKRIQDLESITRIGKDEQKKIFDETNKIGNKIDQTDFPSRFDLTNSKIFDLQKGIEKLFERMDLEEKKRIQDLESISRIGKDEQKKNFDETNKLVNKFDQTNFSSRFDSMNGKISDLQKGIEILFEKMDQEEKKRIQDLESITQIVKNEQKKVRNNLIALSTITILILFLLKFL
jgi:predicted nuclease with TOPRIM domain